MNSNQQPQYRPNRTALWLNNRKQAASQPDLKGNVEITYALVQELLAAFNSGAYEADRGGQPCIKLDIALYLQQQGQSAASATGKQKPYLSGQLSTLAQTQQSAMLRQQAAQQYQQQSQPQAVQPQPQQAPQWPQPAPVPQPMPQQPQPAPQQYAQPAPQQYAQPAPQQYAQPAPAYQQQLPQQPIPALVPPPAPVPGMPGAIHAQLPAGF